MDLKKIIGISKEEGNFVLIHTNYYTPVRAQGFPGAIDLIYKDMKTKKKILKTIKDPEIKAYMLKSNEYLEYAHIEIERERVDEIRIKYGSIYKEIAKLTDNKAFYNECFNTGQYRELDRLHMDNRLFSTDVDIEDHYRAESLKYLGKQEYTITKGFLDIEADIKLGYLDLKSATGEAPVNAITLIDSDNKHIYTLLLRNNDNPLIEEFEENIDNFIKYMKNAYDDQYGKFEYHIKFLDNEIDLIIDLFTIINLLNLDFILIWNMSFDIRYLYHRIVSLGYDPREIMCHNDFPYKTCYYYRDEGSQTIEEMRDFFKVSSYTVFLDQMKNYATIRKQEKKTETENNKLETIGQKEVGAGKLDYNGITTLRNLPYVNFWVFVEYNIRDTLVQHAIEEKTNDLDLIFAKCYDTCTRYNKAFNDTVYLRNKYAYFIEERLGKVLGNNQNKYNIKPKTKFSGAVVGDSNLLYNEGLSIFSNKKSNALYGLTEDFDYTAHYPMTNITHNIFQTSLIGKIIFENMPNEREYVDDINKYRRNGAYLNDIECDEPMLLGYKWLNLPSITEILQEEMIYRKDKDITLKIRANKIKED